MFEVNRMNQRTELSISWNLLKMYFEASCPLTYSQFEIPVIPLLITSISALLSKCALQLLISHEVTLSLQF